jgi:hypothetical protein
VEPHPLPPMDTTVPVRVGRPARARVLTPGVVREITAGLMTLAAVCAIVYLAVVRGDAAAVGALISVTSAAVGYLFRGRLQEPGNG